MKHYKNRSKKKVPGHLRKNITTPNISQQDRPCLSHVHFPISHDLLFGPVINLALFPGKFKHPSKIHMDMLDQALEARLVWIGDKNIYSEMTYK